MNASQLSPSNARKPVSMGEHKRVALRAFTALAEMCNGTARLEEFQDLCDSVNVVDALGTMGKFDPEQTRALVDQAIAGLEVAIKCPPGLMRMSASSTFALRCIVSMHDEAISKFSAGTLFTAWQLVLAKIADMNAKADQRVEVNA